MLVQFGGGVNNGSKILDVGCGKGAFLDIARRYGLDTCGVEIAADSAGVARAKGHCVFHGSIESGVLPADVRVDFVTMWDVLEHVREPRVALRECVRVLQPGGRLILVTPMMGSTYDRCGLAISRLTAGRGNRLVTMCWNEHHINRFAPKGLEIVLQKLGMQDVQWRPILQLSLTPEHYAGDGILPSLTGWAVVDRTVSRSAVACARWLGLQNKCVVVARKARSTCAVAEPFCG